MGYMRNKTLYRHRSGLVPAIWCVGIGLLVNAVLLTVNRSGHDVFPSEISLAGLAQAQPPLPGGGMRMGKNAYLMPMQLGRNSWGMVLVDTQRHVFAVYRILASASRVRLMAARNYRYDLMLKDFNNATPTPFQVKTMVTPANNSKQ